jgi:hypothetical protein
VRYVLRLDSGRTLTVHTAEPRASHGEGARVSLHWDPASVWILPRAD